MDTSLHPPPTTAHTPVPTGVTQGQGEITLVEMNENVTVGLCFWSLWGKKRNRWKGKSSEMKF